jgi:hypothetical protein
MTCVQSYHTSQFLPPETTLPALRNPRFCLANVKPRDRVIDRPVCPEPTKKGNTLVLSIISASNWIAGSFCYVKTLS